MAEGDRDPLLLTPGPLTTADSTKRAMLHDWGSRDSAFIAMTARVRRRLVEIAGGGDLVAVPLQGSGTFAVEAALGTFVPRDGKVLVLVNGAYGARMARISQVIGRARAILLHHLGGGALDEFRAFRPRADDRHVAAQHRRRPPWRRRWAPIRPSRTWPSCTARRRRAS